MKKTIISITLILSAFATVYSCRNDDMDQLTEKQIPTVKNQQNRIYSRSDSDSLQTYGDYLFRENESPKLDPPPKDRDHW